MQIEKFNELLKTNLTERATSKKIGGKDLTYLSWSDAVEEFTKAFPNWTYAIRTNEKGLPYFGDDKVGYMVFTSITVGEETKEMWLPVLNYSNQAVKAEKADMAQINKTIMRCLVKNMAMFGLGLKIYQGEDLPEETKEVAKETKTTSGKPREDLIKECYVLKHKLGLTNESEKAIMQKAFGKNTIDELTNLELEKVITDWTNYKGA